VLGPRAEVSSTSVIPREAGALPYGAAGTLASRTLLSLTTSTRPVLPPPRLPQLDMSASASAGGSSNNNALASTSKAGGVPPSPSASSIAAGSTSAAASITTKEEATTRYLALKNSLKAGVAKKRLIDRTLTDIESQLWIFEGSYLAATAAAGGNIVKGFDNYLKASASGTSGSTYRSSGNTSASHAIASGSVADVPNEDRMFSLSSATYLRSLELQNGAGLDGADKSMSLTGLGGLASNRQSSPADTSVEPGSAREDSKPSGGAGSGRGRKAR